MRLHQERVQCKESFNSRVFRGSELQYGAPGLALNMTDPVFVFGSFSESEAKIYQSPPPAVKHTPHKDGGLLAPILFGDLTGQSVSVADKSTSAHGNVEVQQEGSHNGGSPKIPSSSHLQVPPHQNGATVSSRSQLETTPAEGDVKADGAAPQERGRSPASATFRLESNHEAEELNGVGRDGQGQAHALGGSAELGAAKLAPKSWAALVGVQPTAGDVARSTGQGRSAGVAVSKPTMDGLPRVQPRGLVNTGNSCFANATLQALLSCPPFVHLLLSVRSRGISQTGFPTLVAFANFVGQFQIATEPEQKDQKQGPIGPVDVGRPFAPVMFDDVLRNFSPDQPPRGRPRQEDAQEFLSHVMDRMHEELLWLEGTSVAGQHAVLDEDDWETVGPKNRSALTRTHMSIKSPLSDIFGGQLCSVVKAKGNKASATVQPFLVMHLDILPDAVQTLEDALRFFAAPETLEGYKAASSKATEVVSASKAIKIQALPQVLVLHFMRFSYGAAGSAKINKAVRFPLNLTLGRELLASSTGPALEGRKYELLASVTHHGKDSSVGHYTADCKQRDGRWLRFDDAVVSVVPVNRVLQEHAYVLFYKRTSI